MDGFPGLSGGFTCLLALEAAVLRTEVGGVEAQLSRPGLAQQHLPSCVEPTQRMLGGAGDQSLWECWAT